MTNIVDGSGKYGVFIKWNGGGTTTHFFPEKATRDSNFKRIKVEVGKQGRVSKKDR